MKQHLILYDASCLFCQNAVDKVMRWDKKAIFLYTPLESALGKKIIEENVALKNINSLILIEKYHTQNKRIWLKGRAIFRIFWLLGGFKKCMGWLAYFPIGIDAVYSLVARHRHRLKRPKN